MLSWLFAVCLHVKTNPQMTAMSTVHVVACKLFPADIVRMLHPKQHGCILCVTLGKQKQLPNADENATLCGRRSSGDDTIVESCRHRRGESKQRGARIMVSGTLRFVSRSDDVNLYLRI